MSAKLLIVEDNPGDVLLLKQAMRTAGFECSYRVINNGQDAMTFIEKPPPERPRLILLDLNLPRYSGWDLLACIKQQPALWESCVMILSTSCASHDLEKAQNECVPYIQKPIDFQGYLEVAEIIRKVYEMDPLPTLRSSVPASQLTTPPKAA